MNLNFKEFQKQNLTLKELDSIRIKNFKIFETKGLPSKKQEHWKYTDLKTIINNSFSNLEILNSTKNNKYNKNLLISKLQHNEIILLNGNFIEKNFSFEDSKKVNVKSLKTALKDKNDFEKLKTFFNDDQNSMISLNNALTNDGIILEVEDDYVFNKPLVIYNFFNKSSHNKIINNKVFITLGKNSKLSLIEFCQAEDNFKYFNNTIHNYTINKNSILKKFNIDQNLNNSYSSKLVDQSI